MRDMLTITRRNPDGSDTEVELAPVVADHDRLAGIYADLFAGAE
jgi:hypothetical protein